MTKEADQSLSFIGNWVLKAKQRNPKSAIVEAICDASENDVLDEERLLASLQAIVDPAEEEE